MKSKTTLKKIALQLGFSVSTVSKALNNSPEIGTSTKIKIQEFAKLNHYKPNITALNLKNKSTKTIGVIIPNILNSFFAKVFTGIEKIADEKGYHIITCISDELLEKEIHAMQMLSNGTVDGFILSVAAESQKKNVISHFVDNINDGTPIVMFDRVANDVKCDKVVVNDYEAAVDATNYLIQSGCKKIALFSSIDNLSVGKLRVKGYYDALEINKQYVNPEFIICTDNKEEFNIKASFLFETSKIDGIFAINEHTAVAAIKLGLKYGYKIPEELSIIGFADGVWSRRLTPSLSTMSQHGPEIGETAARLLINRLENKAEPIPFQKIVIKTKLKQRESTK
jgi:LacI family transcriptional regulator